MKDLARLLTDTTVYREVSNWSRLRLLATYVSLYLVVGVISVGAYLAFTKPELQNQAHTSWGELVQAWPENLVIQYKNGELSASPSATLQVAYPSNIPREGLPSTLLTLDTKTSERPTNTESLIVVTKTELGTQDSPGSYRWLPLSEVFESNELTFNRSFLNEQTPMAEDFISFSLKAAALFVFVGTAVLLPLVRLAIATVFTLFTPHIFTLFGNSKEWKTVWKVGFVLLPLAELAQVLVSLLTRPHSLHIFWIIWLIMIVLVNFCNPKRIR